MRAVPDDPELLYATINMLLQVGESAAAHELLGHPVWEQTKAESAWMRYADFRHHFGESAQALEALDRLIARHPDNSAIHCYRAQQLESLGRFAEAEAAFKTCLALSPRFGHAAYHLARLHGQTSASDCLALIQTGLGQARGDRREYADFEFARYHALENLGQTDTAWTALVTGNAWVHTRTAAEVTVQREQLQRWHEAATARPTPATATKPGRRCPIFIVGMPRSGTTVLDRMLSNHSQVTSAGELTDFSQQLAYTADTCSDRSEKFCASLRALDFAEVGRRYLAQVAWRAGDKLFFIDKQPANWMVAGFIHAALPQAKILHLMRDSMDVCFSVWRTRFANAHVWSYDLAGIAAHYDRYRSLMNDWHAMYPGAIMDVPYADLVRTPARTLRQVFAFCGLPWESGCEDLTRNHAPVLSSSAPQVREPVHTRALGEWHRYAKQLEPLRQALGHVAA